MANELGFLTFDDLRGGRNGVDTPLAVPEHQCVEAINVDFYNARLGRRRKGAIVYSPAIPPAFALWDILTLIRHQPFGPETNNQLWAIDQFGNTTRLIANAWANLGKLPDWSGATDFTRVHWASFNNKLFLAYGGGVSNNLDRMHVFDPVTNTIRKAGLAASTIPAIAAAAGTGITGSRWYRVVVTQKISGVVVRRGDVSPIQGLTLTNQGGWVVSHGTFPGEGETHWELHAAVGTGFGTLGAWYLIADLPIATASFTDTTTPANFPPSTALLAPQAGANTPLPSAKFLLVDDARLLLAGWWPTAPVGTNSYESRVWWTPILYDASQVANDEHLNLFVNPYIDFDPGDGGEITGLGGPLFDSPYVFKYNRIYKMVRTGLADAPYRPVTISKSCGCIHQRTIIRGEDENGAECLYFLSKRGPYRIGAQGLQYIGRDIEDLWRKVNLDKISGAPTSSTNWANAHGIYHQDMHQVWWYLPTTLALPSMKIVFDVRLGKFTDVDGVRGGWVQHLGASCEAWASTVFSKDWDGINGINGVTVKPLISQSGNATSPSAFNEAIEGLPIPQSIEPVPSAANVPNLWQCDVDNVYVDVTDKFAVRLTTRAVAPSGTVALHGGVIEGHVLGGGILGAPSLTVYTCRDFFAELRAATAVTLPQIGTITRTIVPVRDLGAVSAAALQILIVDLGTSGFGWHLDELVLRIRKEEDR